MTDLNMVVLCGRVVRTPSLVKKGDLSILEFTIAVNRSYKDKNSEKWVEQASYITMSTFGQKAESLHNRIEKGKLVNVQGRLYQSIWEKDGKKHSELKVSPEKIFVLPESKKSSNDVSAETEMNIENPSSQTYSEEEINMGNEFEIF